MLVVINISRTGKQIYTVQFIVITVFIELRRVLELWLANFLVYPS